MTSPASGQVDIFVDASSVTAVPGMNTGSFEIFANHQLASDPSIIGFQLAIESQFNVGSGSQISFTNITTPLGRPYALAPSSAGPVGSIAVGGNSAQLGDFLLTGSQPLQSGEAFALVEFELDLTSPDPFQNHSIVFDSDASASFILDQDNQAIPLTFNSGSINVSVIPEPSSAPLVVTAILSLLCRRKRSSIRA